MEGWRVIICGGPQAERTGVALLVPPSLQKHIVDFALVHTRILYAAVRTIAGPLHLLAHHAPPASCSAASRQQHYQRLGMEMGRLPQGALRARLQ